MIFSTLQNEYWYGGCVCDGIRLPIKPNDNAVFKIDSNPTPNQAMPLFLSSRGRYLWRDTGFSIRFCHGTVECPDDVELREGYGTLRGAYLDAMQKHFPFHSIRLSDKLFQAPIFNSWIELTFNQNEDDLLRYAKAILNHGFAPSVLMIDDGWSESYGDWRFHSGKFPHSKAFLDTLHEMGFSVMVWICPFITPDTAAYRGAKSKNLLVRTPKGEPFVTQWWNGFSAVLDMSNPDAVSWLDSQLEALQKLGVDGFKFDAGDSAYYQEDNVTYGNVSPDEQSRLWAAYGEKYPLNEYRVTFRAGGYSLFQRLCDKDHSWGEKGMASLIPDTLTQGITGHPFCCADMVGGGEYLNFQQQEGSGLDAELFVRHSGVSCLMPAIQFSAAPWRFLSGQQCGQIQAQLTLRQELAHDRAQLLDNCKQTGEPMIRYMEYQFPDAGMESVTDQFMLGEKLLIAPICEKGCISRKVHLPKGHWRFGDFVLESNGETIELTPPDGLPVVLEYLEA